MDSLNKPGDIKRRNMSPCSYSAMLEWNGSEDDTHMTARCQIPKSSRELQKSWSLRLCEEFKPPKFMGIFCACAVNCHQAVLFAFPQYCSLESLYSASTFVALTLSTRFLGCEWTHLRNVQVRIFRVANSVGFNTYVKIPETQYHYYKQPNKKKSSPTSIIIHYKITSMSSNKFF